MDRQIVYPGSIPLDTDILLMQRHTMVALGFLAQSVLGTSPVADGLACTATSPASMQVVVGSGSLSGLSVLDSQGFGTLPAEPSSPLLKMGINTGSTPFDLIAPTNSGHAITWLVQASLSEIDSGPAVLPYYNAATPSQPFTGPDNSGSAQLTQRLQRVQLQCKPGAAAPTGIQSPPPVDNGWVGLYLVTTSFGQTAISPANIAVLPNAPFLTFKLPRLTPGFSRSSVISASTVWTVPVGVSSLRVRLVGGGGGGDVGYAGGGGGAGGYAEGVIPVQPGQQFALSVGSGGAGSPGRSTAAPGNTTSFAGLLSATAGGGGGSANPYSPGGTSGQGSGGSLAIPGGFGGDGYPNDFVPGGYGGASAFGGGGRGSRGGGGPAQGQAPGSGGGGGYQIPSAGGTGAAGLIVIEY